MALTSDGNARSKSACKDRGPYAMQARSTRSPQICVSPLDCQHLEGLCLWLGSTELRSRYNIPTRRILTVDVNKKDCDSVSLDGSLWASQLFKCAQTCLQTAADSPADCCRTSARPFIAAGRSHLDKGECVTPSPLARPCPALAGHRMPPPGHLVLCPAWRARWRRGR